ncbi:DUF995 domain-containing protein, partial [Sinorhizobium medicae]|nr:DUF995 domain-containing protein [Sinorhizobium medicae]
MKSMNRGIPLAIVLVAGLATASFAEAAAARADRKTTALTHAELFQLYGQKSWIWKEGAGYFSVQARR